MKIIKIKKCEDCPNKHTWIDNWGITKNSCSIKTKFIQGQGDLIMKKIEDINSIPTWCPLEDYKDENN